MIVSARPPRYARANASGGQGGSFLLALAAVCLVGCGGASTTPVPTPEAPQATPPATQRQPATRPSTGTASSEAPFAPISSRGRSVAGSMQTPQATGNGPTVLAPGAAFTLPAAWQREQPRSSMRLAQATIPGEGGPAQLTVFHFGAGGGGGVDANLDRWQGQIELAGAAPSRETFAADPFRVTWMDVAGTLKPSTIGVGPTTPQPNSRLLGAVVEGAGGPWFFKIVGPDATVAAARDDFLALLRSAEPR